MEKSYSFERFGLAVTIAAAHEWSQNGAGAVLPREVKKILAQYPLLPESFMRDLGESIAKGAIRVCVTAVICEALYRIIAPP